MGARVKRQERPVSGYVSDAQEYDRILDASIVKDFDYVRRKLDEGIPDAEEKETFPALVNPAKVAYKPIRLGVHLFGFSDFSILTQLPINMVEIKPQKFPTEEKLWGFDGNQVVENPQNMKKLNRFLKGKAITAQIHLPDSFDNTDGTARRLSIGMAEDHEQLYEYFRFLEEMRTKHKLSDELVVTIHPPYEVLRYDFNGIMDAHRHKVKSHTELLTNQKQPIEKQLLENANTFLKGLGERIERGGWNIVVGIENQAYPSADSWSLGYRITDFEAMMKDTKDPIQLTFDTGHSLLSRDDEQQLTFKSFLDFAVRSGKHLVDYHMHGNIGWKPDPKRTTYHMDAHQFPDDEHIPGFRYHLGRAVVERVPCNLEININDYEQKDLKARMDRLWKRLQDIKSL